MTLNKIKKLIMKKVWMTGGLLIAGLMIIGFTIDKIFEKENLFISLGFGLGLIILAILVFKNRNLK